MKTEKVSERLSAYEGRQLFIRNAFPGLAEYSVTDFDGRPVIDTQMDNTADGLLSQLLDTAYRHGWALRVQDGSLVLPMPGRKPVTILTAHEWITSKEG